MATKPDRMPDLSIEQEKAVALILLGKTDVEVAEAVGVSRQTVNTWRNHDSNFATVLNGQRQGI